MRCGREAGGRTEGLRAPSGVLVIERCESRLRHEFSEET